MKAGQRRTVLRVGRHVDGVWDAREPLLPGDLVTTSGGWPVVVVGRLAPGRLAVAFPPLGPRDAWEPGLFHPNRLERGWPRHESRRWGDCGDYTAARFA